MAINSSMLSNINQIVFKLSDFYNLDRKLVITDKRIGKIIAYSDKKALFSFNSFNLAKNAFKNEERVEDKLNRLILGLENSLNKENKGISFKDVSYLLSSIKINGQERILYLDKNRLNLYLKDSIIFQDDNIEIKKSTLPHWQCLQVMDKKAIIESIRIHSDGNITGYWNNGNFQKLKVLKLGNFWVLAKN